MSLRPTLRTSNAVRDHQPSTGHVRRARGDFFFTGQSAAYCDRRGVKNDALRFCNANTDATTQCISHSQHAGRIEIILRVLRVLQHRPQYCKYWEYEQYRRTEYFEYSKVSRMSNPGKTVAFEEEDSEECLYPQ